MNKFNFTSVSVEAQLTERLMADWFNLYFSKS